MPSILAIDDDTQMRELLQRALERAGYEVIVASDGKRGMRICEERHIDLVITDIVMPEVEGLEMIMWLKRQFPNTKIIAVSGGGSVGPTNYLTMASTLGADHTTPKPFDLKELLKTVKELVK